MNKLWILLLIFGLSSCATYEQQRSATKGAVVGGVAGAVIGANSGRAIEGAAIGAAVGAAAGAVLASPRNQPSYGQSRRHRAYQNAVGRSEDNHDDEYEHDD